MLRCTLRFLRALKGPSIPSRPVMAKATRPVAARGAEENVSHAEHHETEFDSTSHALSPVAHESPLPVHENLQEQPDREEAHNDGDKSEDAYRFLLHHIDSEIAALKRRVQTVSKQRETVESGQMNRIRELFECIERPWLLLDSVPAPQLPTKAFEVYVKEQSLRRSGGGSDPTGKLVEDPVFLDACRRNWRGLSIAHRKPYEVAGRRNDNLRKELKKKMANGCAHFESFCDVAKEWTAEMVREETNSGPQVTKKNVKSPLARRAVSPKAHTKASADAMDRILDEEELDEPAVAVPSPKTSRKPSAGKRNARTVQKKPTGRNVSASASSVRLSKAGSKKTVAHRTHRDKKAQAPKKATGRAVRKK